MELIYIKENWQGHVLDSGILQHYEADFEIGEENKGKELCGGILVKPLISGKHDDSLQFIPLYKEEISFAERLGSRKFRNMFKHFAPEEINEARPDRYNIITDIDGRRNCF